LHACRSTLEDPQDGGELECLSKGRDLIFACGDRVLLSQVHGRQGVIESVLERSSLIYRADGFKQKLVAANVTQIVAIIAPLPAYSDELLNRWLVCAEASGVKAAIGLNKVDLAEAAATLTALDRYRELGYPVIPFSAKFNPAPIRERLLGERTVLIGQSGMGKSKLLNALVGEEAQRTGEISEALDSGRHTTTFTRLFHLDRDSWIIDSPGMQVFGLAHFSRGQIEAAFTEFRPVLGRCRFRDCRPLHEPDCALRNLVEQGLASPQRLTYLRKFCAESEAVLAYARH
jgi:ribosome small subunit-dependent GTPase A